MFTVPPARVAVLPSRRERRHSVSYVDSISGADGVSSLNAKESDDWVPPDASAREIRTWTCPPFGGLVHDYLTTAERHALSTRRDVGIRALEVIREATGLVSEFEGFHARAARPVQHRSRELSTRGLSQGTLPVHVTRRSAKRGGDRLIGHH